MNAHTVRPHCSMHPEGMSSRSCLRCGSFLCEVCTPGAHCPACLQKVEIQAHGRLLARLHRGMLIGIGLRAVLVVLSNASLYWTFTDVAVQVTPFVALVALHLMTRSPLVPWVALAADVLIFGRMAAATLMWMLASSGDDRPRELSVAAFVAGCAALIAATAVRAVRIALIQRRIRRTAPSLPGDFPAKG